MIRTTFMHEGPNVTMGPNAPTKAMAAAILVTLGLMLAAGAAEQSQPSAPADLDKLVGQPVDLSPWTYVWRADREVQEKPESWFIPRRLKRIDEVYRPLVEMQFPGVMPHLRGNTMPAAPKGQLLAAQLWLAPVPTQRIELRWPEGSVVPPAEAIEVRVYPSDVGWFGFVVDKVLAAAAVSADGRTLTYLNETQDSQGKKTPLFGSTDMVAVFLDQSKTPAGAKYGCPSIHLRLASDRMVWSEINLEIEWGFQPGAEQAVFDGRIESWCAYVKSVKPLPEDKGTEMTGANTWRSSPGGGGRRGIAVSVVYLGRWEMGKYVAPIHGRITLLTKGGDVTVMPGDAIDGPILIPGVGVMVTKAGGKATARQVADELAAKNPKTIPQLAREHPEAASWEELMRKVKEPGTVIPPLVPFEEPPVTAMRVSLPDDRWTDAWRRSSWLLKEARYKWGKIALEVARPIRTTDLVGHSDVASRLLEYWLAAPGVKPDGDFVDGDGGFEYATAMKHDMSFGHDSSHPSTGRMLYTMADHYLLTGDREWFQKNRARITAAAEWILRQHSEYLRDLPGRQDLDVAGIHPPHMLGDFIPAKSHWGWYFMQDGFSLMGLRRFADALADFDPEAAQRYRDRNDAYAKDVLRAVEREIARAPVRKVRDGTYRRIIPSQAYLRGSKVLEVRTNHGAFDVEAGALPLAHAVVDAADPRVGEYLEVNEEWHAQGQNEDPFWSGFAGLVKLSYPDTTHLRRDDVPCFLRYWMVNYAGWVSANGGMGEGGTRKLVGNPADKPGTGGDSDLGSVGWFMEGFRNLLVMEAGPSLWLARATPRVWLEQGKKISVTNAPTEFGAVAYEIVSDVDNGKINATVEMPARKPPKEVVLRFRHPKAAPIKSVTINGKEWTEFNNDKETITLKGLAGTVSVTARY